MINKREITDVWGTRDGIEIVFHHIEGDQWECSVPPDTEDGVYAVELWAKNVNNLLGHWVGELFMCSGICHLRIEERDFDFWFSVGDAELQIDEDVTEITISKHIPSASIEIEPTKQRIFIEKGCVHQ